MSHGFTTHIVTIKAYVWVLYRGFRQFPSGRRRWRFVGIRFCEPKQCALHYH